jgi:hypothetical protein
MAFGGVAALVLSGAEPAVGATLVVHPTGTACVPGDSVHTTIQSAVNAAVADDTILVCAGTYVEQVTIGTGKDGLTLQSVVTAMPLLLQTWYIDPQSAMIKAPASMVDPKAIFHVSDSDNVTIEGFQINGPGGSGCNSIRYGILVDGSATINRNAIIDIRDVLEPSGQLSGCQNGIGIRVGRKYDPHPNLVDRIGTATITNNGLWMYQKGGIVVDNAGSDAIISGNAVAGAGPQFIIGQNGIQVSRGASATVRLNAILDHEYTGCSSLDAAQTGCTPWVATGLLLYDVEANAVKHSKNFFRRNQADLRLLTSESLDPGP